MMNTDKRLNWIDSAGGPLILIEQTYLNHWKGIFSDQEPTDYNRACAIDNYIGLIEVGDGKALVLGDLPMRTAWSPLPNEPGGIIICWGYANNEASVAQAVSSVPEETWSETGITFQVGKTSLFMFDSARDRGNIEESLRINLAEGRYSINTADYKPDEETWLVLHRLRLGD